MRVFDLLALLATLLLGATVMAAPAEGMMNQTDVPFWILSTLR